MPRLIPRGRQWKNDELVRPLQPFSGDVDGVPVTFNPANRLRADDPVVKRWPTHFVRVESADEDVAELVTETYEEMTAAVKASRAVEEASRPPKPKPIPLEQAVQAVETFNIGGRHVPKGSYLHRDDPLVAAHPHLFRTAPTPLEAG